MSKARVATWIAMGTVLAGCQQPLFPSSAPRTQFETYDRMRHRNQQLEEPDAFGNPQPALRARLSPQK